MQQEVEQEGWLTESVLFPFLEHDNGHGALELVELNSNPFGNLRHYDFLYSTVLCCNVDTLINEYDGEEKEQQQQQQ